MKKFYIILLSIFIFLWFILGPGNLTTYAFDTGTGATMYTITDTVIFNDLDFSVYDSPSIYVYDVSGKIVGIDNHLQLNNIEKILYQILIVLVIFVFFFLIGLFYYFLNDLIGKN